MSVNSDGIRVLGDVVRRDELRILFEKWPISEVLLEGETLTDDMNEVVRFAREYNVVVKAPDNPALLGALEDTAA